MKARDVNVGNSILMLNKEGEWENKIVSVNTIVAIDTTAAGKFYKGTPITVDLLLKRGFVAENTDEMNWFFKEHESVSFGLSLVEGKWLFYLTDTRLVFMHEVENLWYWLTKTELK